MFQTTFTPLSSLSGGLLIGLSAVVLMAFNGRIAGMTGFLAGLITRPNGEMLWRIAFLGGAIIAPALFLRAYVQSHSVLPFGLFGLIIGGICVGIGVTYGSGCTSGHAICGLARFSKRSLVATLTFMATTFLTVTLIRHGLKV